MLSLGRADRSALAEWWWTVDRVLVAAILCLAVFGIVFTMAASPPVALKLGLDQFHFVKRQAAFLSIGLGAMLMTSLLTARQMRRVALVLFAGGLVLMVIALFQGPEIKGARRWIEIAGFSLQPSEFVKPAFVLLAAWLFAEGGRRPDIPGASLATGLLIVFVALLLLQPDVGQALLTALVWGALFFMAGMAWPWIIMLGGLGMAGLFAAYTLVPHVTARVDRFLDPASGDTYQIDTALESFIRGGWFGRGPGEGTVKRLLPDSHTDFVFAVTAEEYGIIVCLTLLALFAFIVLRVLLGAFRETDPFMRFAVGGLIVMFGLQAAINMGVNLALLPAKGMTLPLISAGGSSTLSMCYALGMVLGLTRRRVTEESVIDARLLAGGRGSGP
ncbi:MAG: putative lipid II flippase FtsW [Hyphomicrobiales bacterium]|nr:putative lipid II flippase FtsW [Hyphomicrobiales bacterium]